MTRYAMTGRGVLWSFCWLGVGMLYLAINSMTHSFQIVAETIIYFSIIIIPLILLFVNNVATKLGLHKEVSD